MGSEESDPRIRDESEVAHKTKAVRKLRRPTKVVLVCVSVIALLLGGGLIGAWLQGRLGSDSHDPAFDPSKVSEVQSVFPKDAVVRVWDKRIFTAQDAAAADAANAKGVTVSPERCRSSMLLSMDRAVGSQIYTVGANLKGVIYSVNAQVIPDSNPARQRPDQNCKRTVITHSDGTFSIYTPVEIPRIDGVEVEGFRTVSRTPKGETVDSYTFKAWIDDYRVVLVNSVSDPRYNPPSNPIDPALSKNLLESAVNSVRS